jgi:NDP-sugar pyrophosphorylase family protein
VLGGELEAISSTAPRPATLEFALAEPLECVEVMGRSMLDRMVERFSRAGVKEVSILTTAEIACMMGNFSTTLADLKVHVVTDMRSSLAQKLGEYAQSGIEHAFVVSGSLYTETDLLDLFYFHREARQPATRACERQVPLDLWVVDCAEAQGMASDHLLRQSSRVAYYIREYVNCLTHARDLRRLVSDVLRGRCAMRPPGKEVRPGVWIEATADIHRRARIVAPAYIGSGSEIREDTLITRCSNVERGCYIDYGTVIEDSSVLANTHVGIWLDLCHSVASANKLFNLEKNVILDISDPSIMRARSSVRETHRNFDMSFGLQPMAFELESRRQQKTPTQKTWQFGANPVQG